MERQAISVQGLVQGVGFRPFVYGLAARWQLRGFVMNRTGSVLIEVEGEPTALQQFRQELREQAPPLARIDQVECQNLPPRRENGFRIEASESDPASPIFISPDVAPCADCLAELFDPADRRYRYPFLNCTNCGPRLTIIERAPYDRERTTMAGFALCQACRAEYEDPLNRRFHAQPTACPACGPQLAAYGASGATLLGEPLAAFVNIVRGGGIGALKGLGGYHLVCRADDDRAVRELRRRKHRDEKPFAVMLANAIVAARVCLLHGAERTLLESPRRPIVLLRKRRRASDHQTIVAAVAPGNPSLGVMLPYTPLHYLLVRALGELPLVMTSGNRSEEPIAYLDDDALARLGDIADIFLTHNRPIHVRCDDSVMRVVRGLEQPLRRSRGYAPEPIQLPHASPAPLLAVGGQLKGAFALGREQQAFLSHHLGDLDEFAAFAAFERDVRLYEELFAIRPQLLVHDLHPGYATTGYALRRGAAEGLPLLGVQHHHAHLASCLAEHGIREPAMGVCFDGTGYGLDGTIWGGEFLVGDYEQFARAAQLRSVRLPGGDRAAREPWRMALSYLIDAGCDTAPVSGPTGSERRTVEQMIERGVQSPFTSSAGRLFDAVAAIAGVRSHVSFEGQAAMQLEWLASDSVAAGVYPFEFAADAVPPVTWCGAPGRMAFQATESKFALSPFTVDTRPLLRAIAEDVRRHTRATIIARRFHSTLVEIIAAACARIRTQTHLAIVALSGGVFQNEILARETTARLAADGFRVYSQRLVPPGDGGLSLGQLAIGAQVLAACSNFDDHAAIPRRGATN